MGLPKIYLYCLPTGTGRGIVHDSTPGGDVIGYAVAEDGIGICSHLSSNRSWSQHDLGLPPISTWKHDFYAQHYPGGYELEWVDDVEGHAGLQAALEKNRALAKERG